MESRVSVARTTGLLYMGVAITGVLSQVLRAYLFDPGDAARRWTTWRGTRASPASR